jgi:lipoate-protein ligase A
MEKWRLLGLDTHDAYTNMATDEALARLVGAGVSENTIRLYTWKPSAVSIGYFQILEEEVDVEACRSLGFDIVRRMTGGGAVYHDTNGEITYSLVARQGHPSIPSDIADSYATICGGIVAALNDLGVNAGFKPINDIVVGDKKISGNAQTRRFGAIVQHGTVLMDADVRTMFKVLKVGLDKISDKAIKSAEERVTTIRRELGSETGFERVAEALKGGFSKTLNIELVEGRLNEEERKLRNQLREQKYATRRWTFERPASDQSS